MASKSSYLQIQLNELENLIEESSFSQETIQKGINDLRAWLIEKGSNSGPGRSKIFALAAISILTPVAVFVFGWYGLLGILPLLIVLFSMFAGKSTQDGGKDREIWERDFTGTGLPEPESWTEVAVKSALADLENRMGIAKIQETHISRKAQLTTDITRQEEKVKEIRTEGQEYLSRLGAMPELPWDNPEDYDKLLLVSRPAEYLAGELQSKN